MAPAMISHASLAIAGDFPMDGLLWYQRCDHVHWKSQWEIHINKPPIFEGKSPPIYGTTQRDTLRSPNHAQTTGGGAEIHSRNLRIYG